MSDAGDGLGRGLGALIPAGAGQGRGDGAAAARRCDVLITGPRPRAIAGPATSVPGTAGVPGAGAPRRRRAGEPVARWFGADGSPTSRCRRSSPNPRQPRTVFDEEALAELAHSLREVGLLQPVVVAARSAERPVRAHHGRAAVAGGPRRPASPPSRRSSRPPVTTRCCATPCWRTCTASQLNPLEEAAAYDQLLQDFGCTHDELAGRIGRSRPQISNTLRLLKLPPLVQRRVAAGVLSAGHARALLGLDDAAAQERLAQRIVAEGLSVRDGRGDRRPRRRRGTGQVEAQVGQPAGRAEARGPRRPALRPVRDPGQGRPRPVQGPDRGGVRVAGRPGADRRRDGPGRRAAGRDRRVDRPGVNPSGRCGSVWLRGPVWLLGWKSTHRCTDTTTHRSGDRSIQRHVLGTSTGRRKDVLTHRHGDMAAIGGNRHVDIARRASGRPGRRAIVCPTVNLRVASAAGPPVGLEGSEGAVSRRLASLTLDNLDDLPATCRRCVFWELDPVARQTAAEAGDPELEKEAWLSATLLDWGSCGKIVYVDSLPAGYVTYAPPAHVPRGMAFPTSPVSGDAVLLMTARVLPEFSEGGLARMLVQAAAKDLTRRGVKCDRGVRAGRPGRAATAGSTSGDRAAWCPPTSCSPSASRPCARTTGSRGCGWT